MPGTREKTSWIVGRDTYRLSATEITRATMETLAENICGRDSCSFVLRRYWGITARLFI